MAKVRFLEDYDYRPTATTIVAYEAGMELTVKRECAELAISLGKAVEIGKEVKNSEPGAAGPEA